MVTAILVEGTHMHTGDFDMLLTFKENQKYQNLTYTYFL